MLAVMLLLHRDDMNVNVYFAVRLSIWTTFEIIARSVCCNLHV